jgi:hypothetical protein
VAKKGERVYGRKRNTDRKDVFKALGLERGVWHKQLVGLVYGYPRSAEAFESTRKANKERMAKVKAGELPMPTRRGVPDGWGGRKEELARVRRIAAEIGRRAMAALRADEIIALPTNTDEEKAQAALEVTFATMFDESKTDDQRERARRDILNFCKVKPVAKTEVKVDRAEDFLSALAAEVKAKEITIK